VLRALNDLKFERSVGKITEEDYNELSARYRAEAKRLITRVDESLAETRELAEKLAHEQLKLAGLNEQEIPSTAEASADPKPPEAADEATAGEASAPSESTCVACNTANDLDARFCKRCGKALGQSDVEKDSSTEKFA